MTINSAKGSARLLVDIIPGDPLASGTYQIGSDAGQVDLAAVDQIYPIKVSGQAATATLIIKTGVLTLSGAGTKLGGAGVDPDGQTIAITKLYAIQIKNTSIAELKINLPVFAASKPFTSNILQPGATFHQTIPGSVNIAPTDAMIFGEAGITGLSYEVLLLGKI